MLVGRREVQDCRALGEAGRSRNLPHFGDVEMSDIEMEVKPQAAGLGMVREPTTAPGYNAEHLIEVLTEHAKHQTFKVNALTHQVRILEPEILRERQPAGQRIGTGVCDL